MTWPYDYDNWRTHGQYDEETGTYESDEEMTRTDVQYRNVPEVFAVYLEKPMMYYPAAAMELWHARVEEKHREHIGGRLQIISVLIDGQRRYYISGYTIRKAAPDVRNDPRPEDLPGL